MTIPLTAAPPAPSTRALSPELQQVLTRMRLLAQRRAAWLNYLRQTELAHNESAKLDPARLIALFADRDDPAAEAEWQAAETGPLSAEIARIESALGEPGESRLHRLIQTFGLEPPEIDLLHASLALAIDPTLSRVYASVQPHPEPGYVTEALAARLFGYGRWLRWGSESPLRTWGLVHEREIIPAEPPVLTCDRQIRDWLLGQNELHERLVGLAKIWPPLPPLSGWPLADIDHLLRRTVTEGGRGLCLRVEGLAGSGRRTFAAAGCAGLGLPLLVLDTALIEPDEWPSVFMLAQRQAFLDGCALAWGGGPALTRPWPQAVPLFPVQFIIAEAGQSAPPGPQTGQVVVTLPPLSPGERRALWQRYLPTSAAWPASDRETLAARYQVTVGQIAAIGQQETDGLEQTTALIRAGQRDRLGQLAQRLECPFAWTDLVVSEVLQSTLEDFVFEARERAVFWEQPGARRLFPHGQGLVGLFSGPPGTGKTMAAQVIAASLDLDLFRVDLSAVVSKYVGETSQNLERILSRAAHMDIVLFFDEADALFSKRTEVKDAHDRFANTDTNYLLQAIENYHGVALLSTNKKANLDPAFIRRLRYVVEFPPPDAAQRRRIWQQLVTELAGEGRAAVLQSEIERLAREVPLTGAQIKYALLAALFAARRAGQPLGFEHLLRGLNRELLKEGRALNGREQEKLRLNGRHG